jgi:hypothetical protein
MTGPGLTVITHSVGHSEVIAGLHSRKWAQRTIAKYRVEAGDRTYPEWQKRHDQIVQKIYRIGGEEKVLPYLKKQEDVTIIE